MTCICIEDLTQSVRSISHREQFHSQPTPPPSLTRDIRQCLGTLLVVTTGEPKNCFWHRMGRDQGCFYRSYSVQHSPLTQRARKQEISLTMFRQKCLGEMFFAKHTQTHVTPPLLPIILAWASLEGTMES